MREPALADQSVGELTLQEACVDPTLAVRIGRGVRFRELIREAAAPHFDLFENRVLTGFLGFLRLQINDLRVRIVREIHSREQNRAYRDRRDEDGKSWWQREDAPRLQELAHVLESLAILDGEVIRLLRQPFLPAAPPLRKCRVPRPCFARTGPMRPRFTLSSRIFKRSAYNSTAATCWRGPAPCPSCTNGGAFSKCCAC